MIVFSFFLLWNLTTERNVLRKCLIHHHHHHLHVCHQSYNLNHIHFHQKNYKFHLQRLGWFFVSFKVKWSSSKWMFFLCLLENLLKNVLKVIIGKYLVHSNFCVRYTDERTNFKVFFVLSEYRKVLFEQLVNIDSSYQTEELWEFF